MVRLALRTGDGLRNGSRAPIDRLMQEAYANFWPRGRADSEYGEEVKTMSSMYEENIEQ